MKHATVKNLISALAALYLLNIYNRSDENIKDETKNNPDVVLYDPVIILIG